MERDRVAVVEMATAGLLSELLPVLDDVDRARQHGDLTGAFAAVGERLEQITAKAGLEKYGEPGEPFDPAVHEALLQAEPDPQATVAVCAQVLQPGYRLKGGRVLRPARVSVAEPAAPAAQAADDRSADDRSADVRAADGADGDRAAADPAGTESD
ncbi:MAG TPA: nucleotide exchange factor GrpE [Mycobacteriales bacterium]|nr:nucleotide exchange factor GrpE [Mycobacteriales bacterium]